jgi:hypothetical protein
MKLWDCIISLFRQQIIVWLPFHSIHDNKCYSNLNSIKLKCEYDQSQSTTYWQEEIFLNMLGKSIDRYSILKNQDASSCSSSIRVVWRVQMSPRVIGYKLHNYSYLFIKRQEWFWWFYCRKTFVEGRSRRWRNWRIWKMWFLYSFDKISFQ